MHPLQSVMKSLCALVELLVAGNDFPICLNTQSLFKWNELVKNFSNPPAFLGGVDMQDLGPFERFSKLFKLMNNSGTGGSPVCSQHILQGIIGRPFHFPPFSKNVWKILLTMSRISFKDEKYGSTEQRHCPSSLNSSSKPSSQEEKSSTRSSVLLRASIKW